MNDQHSMNPDVARKLLQVGETFRIPGPFFSYAFAPKHFQNVL